MKIKLTIIVFFGLIISLNVKAQKINLNDLASINLPANSQKVSRTEAINIAQQKNVKVEGYTTDKNRNFLVIDNVFLNVGAIKPQEKVDLNKLKFQVTSMIEGNSGFSFEIINKNGNQFLISHAPTIKTIYLYATNDFNNTYVTGSLNFNEADRSKARSLSDRIISSLSFQK